MDHRTGMLPRATAALAAGGAAVVLAACGGSSSRQATSLLGQAFGGQHSITSGQVAFNLTVTPSGSTTITGPISLAFSGPFQSRGPGKLPESSLDVTLSALGSSVSITFTAVGNKGYVTFEGASYRLPQADYERLATSFSEFRLVPGSGGSSLVHRLGIHPLSWLQNPQVVGTEDIAGTSTSHVHAAINVAAFLDDVNRFLVRAPSLGVSGAASLPRGISAATRRKIAHEVQNPSFDVWVAQAGKTVRKLEVGMTLPVTGTASALLGGLRSAGIGLSEQYSQLNQPQTITAPTALRPYREFQAKLKVLLGQIQAGLRSLLGGGVSGSGAASGSVGSSSQAIQNYSQCVQAAHGHTAKLQKCTSLLSGG